MVAVYDLHTRLDQPYAAFCLGATYLIFAMATVWTVAAVVLGWFAPKLSRWLARSRILVDRAREGTAQEPKHYTATTWLQPRLLQMGVAELAQRAEISRTEAWAMLRNPDVTPNAGLRSRLEHALLLPNGYFWRGRATDGTNYGDDLTTARIERYTIRGLATLHVDIKNLHKKPYPERRELLKRIEDDLSRDIRRGV